MTIETLEYIHKALIEEVKNASDERESAAALLKKYEDCEAATENLIESQREYVKEAAQQFLRTKQALLSFEMQDFR